MTEPHGPSQKQQKGGTFGLGQVANFREVAPSAALRGGRRLRPRALFRAAQLNWATAADIRALQVAAEHGAPWRPLAQRPPS